jgi:hypothetical protein
MDKANSAYSVFDVDGQDSGVATLHLFRLLEK